MDLCQIVDNFEYVKPPRVKSLELSSNSCFSKSFLAEKREETICHHPTPASSPTFEYEMKIRSPPPQHNTLPVSEMTGANVQRQDHDHATPAMRIPVLSTIEIKGVVIDQKTRKFVCQVCNKDFIRKSGLVRHNLIHLGVRPNECQVCGKKFLQKSALTVHYRIHSGEKPYACKHCGRRFGDSSSLCRHYRMHMSKKGSSGKKAASSQ